ncbi:hypothetical protein JCM9492_06430 [Aquifex pyrophilus]
MRNTLLLLFLIVSYNYILYTFTANDLSAIPLFPENPVHRIIVLSFNITLYVGWLFGERRKLVTVLGYLFFFQIILLSILEGDVNVFISNTVPVIFTLMLVTLFESPYEREKKEIEEERRKLLAELEENEKKRKEIEEKIDAYRKEISFLKLQLEQKEKDLEEAKRLKQSLKEIERKEEEVRSLRERLEGLEKELEKQREKEIKLLDANRKLFQLLELLGKEEEKKRGSKEVKELRKERKKLVKEVLELQSLLDLYDKENKELRQKLKENEKKLEEMKKNLEKLELERESLEREAKKKEEIYREFLNLLFPNISLTDEAVREFINLDLERKRILLKELGKLESGVKLETLSTDGSVYKLKFSGGRAYLTRNGKEWKLLGILDSEEDKDKARFIAKIRERA